MQVGGKVIHHASPQAVHMTDTSAGNHDSAMRITVLAIQQVNWIEDPLNLLDSASFRVITCNLIEHLLTVSASCGMWYNR